jgi:hypothetical protein
VKTFAIILTAVIAFVSFSSGATARPPYAQREKKSCNYCHTSDSGGARGFRGMYYNAHGLTFKKYVEKTEAKKAGVTAGAVGAKSKPTKPYTGK